MQYECGMCGWIGELEENSNPVCPDCGSPDLSPVRGPDDFDEGDPIGNLPPDDFVSV